MTKLEQHLYDVLKWHHDFNLRNDVEYNKTAVYRATKEALAEAEIKLGK